MIATREPIGNNGLAGATQDLNVPAIFSRMSSIGTILFPIKGQFNSVEMRPEIINEQNSSDKAIQGVINSTTIIGQSFKASQDNINSIALVLEGAESGISHESFESYADTAALRVAWPQVGVGAGVDLETVIVSPNLGSTKSMKLTLSNVLSAWESTGVAVDVSTSVIAIDWLQDEPYSRMKVELYLEDMSGNIVSVDIVSSQVNLWQTFIWNSQDFQPDIGNPGVIDLTAIIIFGYRVLESRNNRFGYADNMILFTDAGSIDIKLWDFGATDPIAGVNSIDDATQYVTLGDPGIGQGILVSKVNLQLENQRSVYFVKDFIAGPAFELSSNLPLTVGNHYFITLNYVDTDINVYGTDPSESKNRYVNGFAFTAPDEATPVTGIGAFNDIFFNIFSTQEVLFEGAFFSSRTGNDLPADPGSESIMSLFTIDSELEIPTWVLKDERLEQLIELKSNFRVISMDKGGRIVFLLDDDPEDNIASINIAYSYLYEPPIVNG